MTTKKVDMYGNKLFLGARVKYSYHTSVEPIYGYIKILGNHSVYVRPLNNFSQNPIDWHIVYFKDLVHKELEDMI